MMEQQVELSRELLVTLRSAKHLGRARFFTDDESWFWLTIDHDQQWLPPGAERPTRSRKMIGSWKVMTIFWSLLSFPEMQDPPLKVTFTSEFFLDAIFPHIAAAKPAGDPGRRLILHMDNTSPHRARLIPHNLDTGPTVFRLHLTGQFFVELVGRGRRYGSFTVCFNFLKDVTASSHFTSQIAEYLGDPWQRACCHHRPYRDVKTTTPGKEATFGWDLNAPHRP
jgi:hypothetical protein